MARVLVIEDRAPDRILLRTLLIHSRHEVLETGDGADGLRMAIAERPDLVITDMLVPTMDGFEFVRALRREPTVGQTPVIIYTATYNRFELDRLARAAGVSLVIEKPAEPPALLEAVERVLAAGAPPGLAKAVDLESEHKRIVQDKLLAAIRDLRALEALALTDRATGLPNRRGAEEMLTRMLAHAVRASEQFAVVLLAIDAVDLAVELEDGRAGEEIMTAVGESVCAELRDCDLAARWGKEELVLGLPDTGAKQAAELAGKLRVRSRARSRDGIALLPAVSAGVATFPEHGRDLASLVSCAGAALCGARSAGGRTEIRRGRAAAERG